MNKYLMALVLSLAGVAINTALAHGEAQARHGGVVRSAQDLSFELVAQGTGAVIYVEDHGKPLAPTGMTGKLTVLHGSDKSEYPLLATAERLEAAGARLPSGAKAVAVVTTAAKKTITVRFNLK